MAKSCKEIAQDLLSYIYIPVRWANNDYWTLELAPDYSFALVGKPKRKDFWVLSRTPAMDKETLQGILDSLIAMPERFRAHSYCRRESHG